MGKRHKPSRSRLPKKVQSDYINVLVGVNPAKMRSYYDRVATVSGPKNNVNPIKNNTFTKKLENFGQKDKDQCETIFIAWAADRLQGVDKYYRCKRLLDHGTWTFDLFRCGDKYVLRETRDGVSKTSIVYQGERRAMSAFNNSQIFWSKSQTI